LENRPGQLLPIGQMKDDVNSLSEQQRQKRILNKVWAIVEKAMANMKKVLVTQLEDSNRSVDEHEKTLESVRFHCITSLAKVDDVYRFLMDFQSNDEPLWTYLESQNRHIINRMTSEHETSVKKIEGMNNHSLFTSI
jgi:exocyst complex component 2